MKGKTGAEEQWRSQDFGLGGGQKIFLRKIINEKKETKIEQKLIKIIIIIIKNN
jgi:hypothetical protein